MAYHIGQKVKIHGNPDGVIVRKLGATTYEVRLWDKKPACGRRYRHRAGLEQGECATTKAAGGPIAACPVGGSHLGAHQDARKK